MTAKKSGNKEVKKPKLEIELEAAIADKLRLVAELDNTRKRSEVERENTAERSRSEVIAALFPIFDNFYRASTHAPALSTDDFEKISEDDFKKLLSYISGLQQIEKQLESALAEMGLTRIPAKGAEFDPELHEAISHENSKIPADHIIDEVEAGWLLNGRVLRPAKVRVSKG
ncbi:MAG: nucleotide exchange factor GrpE [Patescibacteria group bacterium]